MKSLSLFLGLSGILVPEKQRLMFVASNFLSGKCGVALASRGDPFADWLAGNLPEFRVTKVAKKATFAPLQFQSRQPHNFSVGKIICGVEDPRNGI